MTGCALDPVCGDGRCNGLETDATCCQDCACAPSWECTPTGACAPFSCGDGACNGDETQATCCTDCGCAAVGEVCGNNTCTCPGSTGHFENVRPDRQEFCPNISTFYTQLSIFYVNNLTEGRGWLFGQAGGSFEWSDPQGTAYSMMEQCCYIDQCMGNTTCPTPFGDYPCTCDPVTSYAVTLSVCGETFFPVCDD